MIAHLVFFATQVKSQSIQLRCETCRGRFQNDKTLWSILAIWVIFVFSIEQEKRSNYWFVCLPYSCNRKDIYYIHIYIKKIYTTLLWWIKGYLRATFTTTWFYLFMFTIAFLLVRITVGLKAQTARQEYKLALSILYMDCKTGLYEKNRL